MGTGAANSVINSYGQSHELPNLYVAGPGIFATGGASNPTYTIFALSLRGAEQLAANWGTVAGLDRRLPETAASRCAMSRRLDRARCRLDARLSSAFEPRQQLERVLALDRAQIGGVEAPVRDARR